MTLTLTVCLTGLAVASAGLAAAARGLGIRRSDAGDGVAAGGRMVVRGLVTTGIGALVWVVGVAVGS